MKVLFIASGNKHLGCPVVLNQAASLIHKGIEVDYFFIQGHGLKGYLRNISKIKKQIRNSHYNIFHAHYSFSAFAANLAGAKPLVVSLMGSDVKSGLFFRLFIHIFRFIFQWKNTIVKSEDLKNCLGIKDLYIVPNGVDITTFFPADKTKCRSKLGWDSNKKHLLFAGQPDRKEKNFTLAENAYKTLKDDQVDLHLLDNVPHDEMRFYYNASDVILLTSFWEGSPNVIKEAMACCRPIVSTNVGDVAFLFGSSEGHYICSFDVKDVAEKIKTAFEFELVSKTTKGNHRINSLNLESDLVAGKIIEIYQKSLRSIKSHKKEYKNLSTFQSNITEYKRCTEGIWDTTVPGIKFDTTGVSNFSRMQKTLMEKYPRGEKGLQEWSLLIEKIKSKGKKRSYDCIVGVSGGTDSSYLLHIAHENGLRVLAVNLDNGWSSEIAVSNIKKMCESLQIDLETYVIDYEEVKSVLRSYLLAKLPWIDSPTDIAIKSALYKIASRERIKYIFNGSDFRSEGKQPLAWTYSDTRQLKYIVRKFGIKKLKTYPLQPLRSWIYYGLVKRIKVIRPLYFLPYQKKDAKSILTEKYGWKDYGGHHHENIFTKFIISYWLPVKFGIDKRIITYSAQILSGEMKREEALELIKLPSIDESVIENDIDYVLKKLDLSREEFDKAFHSENKYFFDYPSYYPLIRKFSGIGKLITSRIFRFKPGIYEAMDQRI